MRLVKCLAMQIWIFGTCLCVSSKFASDLTFNTGRIELLGALMIIFGTLTNEICTLLEEARRDNEHERRD